MSDEFDFENDETVIDDSGDEKEKRKVGVHYEWADVWRLALTKPSMETYEALLADPAAEQNRAFKWVFITGTLSVIITMLLQSLLVQTDSIFFQLICAVLLGGAMTLIFYIIVNGLVQGLAKLLGGEGTFGQFYYLAGTFSAPLYVLNAVVTVISAILPCLGIFGLAIFIYQVALMTITVNVVNRFGWGKSIASVIVPFIVLIAIFACFFLAIIGPVIGNTFEQITLTLEPVR